MSADTDPYILFIYGIKSPHTRKKYIRCLKRFFSYCEQSQIDRCKWNVGGPIKEKAIGFVDIAKSKDGGNKVVSEYIRSFLWTLKQQVDSKEIVAATIRFNYVAAIKLFCEMNDIDIQWKKLLRGLPAGRKYARDRAPNIEEIVQLCKYPDRRIKGIVETTLSGGIRVGAWDYLKWGHIAPIEQDGKIIAAKMEVYAGEEGEYFTFITPEAYKELKDWMDFRTISGEHITKDSWLMRVLWDVHTTGSTAAEPRKLTLDGLKTLIYDAIKAQKIRTKSSDKKRYEFQALHGFRKFFKTYAEQAGMKPINVEILMGHSVGISDSYYRPTERELLEDYLKAVPSLTINDTVPASTIKEQSNQIQTLKEQMAEMQQVAESNYKSYEKAKQEIAEYRKELEEKDERRDFYRDEFLYHAMKFGHTFTGKDRERVKELLESWWEMKYGVTGGGGRNLTKEEWEKLEQEWIKTHSRIDETENAD